MILKTKDIDIKSKPQIVNIDGIDTKMIEIALRKIREDTKSVKLPLKTEIYKTPETTMLLPGIKNIFYSDKPGKEVVVVLFEDGTKIIKRPSQGDSFDLNVGVSLAIAEKIFSSKTQYHKYIQSKVVASNKD